MTGFLVSYKENPLGERVHRSSAPEGLTLAEVAASVDELPLAFWEFGAIAICGHEVPRDRWRLVRPREGAVVTLHMPLMGSGGGGGTAKSVVRAVAAIAIVATASAISGGLLAPIGGGLFTSGSVSAALAAGAVSLGGSLLLGAFVRPPSLGQNLVNSGGSPDTGADGISAASLSGNVLRRGAPIPRVLGTHRVFPPFLCQPLVETNGDKEIAEAVYGLAGPHLLESIKLGGTPIESVEEAEVETREGWDDDTALTLITRYGKTLQPGVKMSKHEIDYRDTDGIGLTSQVIPYTDSEPHYHQVNVQIDDYDELWFTLSFVEGLIDGDEPLAERTVPFHMRARPVGGTTWVNFPEFHVSDKRGTPFNRMVNLLWDATTPGPRPTPPSHRGVTSAYTYSFQQELPHNADGWVANSYFYSGSGGKYMNSSNMGSTGVQKTELYEDRVEFYVTDSLLPRADGIEFQIKRGQGFDRSTFTESTYEIFSGVGTGTFFTFQFVANFYMGCRTRSTGSNIPLASIVPGYVMDGVTLAAKDCVLLVNQTTAEENGCWQVASSGSPTRPTTGRWQSGANVNTNAPVVLVTEGTVHARTKWTNTGGVKVVDTDPVTIIASVATFEAATLENQNVLNDDVVISRVSRVWNSSPIVAVGEFALVAIRVEGRSAEELSVLASGYVQDWDGVSAWDDWTTTSNPVPHYRDILLGPLTADPIPSDLVLESDLVAWRALCASKGYTVDMVTEGDQAFDLLGTVAACGYARPRQSEAWGVAVDYDRATESPVQVFSPRNMRGFKWERAFVKRPDGFRVRFDDVSNDYAEKQIIVPRPGVAEVDAVLLEEIRYDGLVDEEKARDRAIYDLQQSLHRFTFYRGEVDAEALVCVKGDLVALQHDTIDSVGGFSRVKDFTVEGGMLTEVELDGSVPDTLLDPEDIFFTSPTDFFDEPSDFFENAREDLGVAVRLLDGTLLTAAVRLADDGHRTDGRTLTLVTPVADPGADLEEGCLVVTGHIGREYIKAIVLDMTPRSEAMVQLTFVDYAPELFSIEAAADFTDADNGQYVAPLCL